MLTAIQRGTYVGNALILVLSSALTTPRRLWPELSLLRRHRLRLCHVSSASLVLQTFSVAHVRGCRT